MEKINSVNDFNFKNKIKGKIRTFSFSERKVTQELDIYIRQKIKIYKVLTFFFSFLKAIYL